MSFYPSYPPGHLNHAPLVVIWVAIQQLTQSQFCDDDSLIDPFRF